MNPLLNRQRVSVVAVLSAMAMVVLDASIVSVALPTIATSLKESSGATILVVSAYQAALLVGLLPAAHLAERVGYRRLFVAGLALFTGASVLCTFAPTLAALVAARVLQGLGGAAIMSLGIALLRFALGPDRLAAAIGWNALTVALCSAAGPVAGALILSVAPWPWLFLAKLPVSAIALAAATALPKIGSARPSVDWRSMALHAASATLVVTAAQSAIPHPYLASVLGSLAVASAALLVRRGRDRPAPLLPMDLLALRPFRVSVAASVCCFTGQSAGLIALPLYLQLSLGKGALTSAFVLTCWPVSVAVASRFANGLTARFGAPALCTAGASLFGLGLLVSAVWPVHGQVAPLALAAAVSGFGFGLFQVPNNRNMFMSAPAERSAAAGGLQGSARLAGQTLGALMTSLLFTGLPDAVAPRVAIGVGAIVAGAAALVSVLDAPGLSRFLSPRSFIRLKKGEAT
jgi:DHA2 family multidrug resistance protein-like MFS transporter